MLENLGARNISTQYRSVAEGRRAWTRVSYLPLLYGLTLDLGASSLTCQVNTVTTGQSGQVSL